MKNILVIGATSEIAKATARLYAQNSSNLYLLARDTNILEITAKDFEIHGASQVNYGFIEITDFFSRYARAVDTRDWDLYRTLFTADAHIDYSSSGGSVGNLEETVSFLSKALDMFEMSQHLVTNIEVLEKEENEADVLALFNNPMRLKGGEIWFVGGRYRHELIRSDAGWKSRKLVEETLWFDRSPFGDLARGNSEEQE